ncbi:hypothetical protein ACJX0J_041516, partial [Zea mays]
MDKGTILKTICLRSLTLYYLLTVCMLLSLSLYGACLIFKAFNLFSYYVGGINYFELEKRREELEALLLAERSELILGLDMCADIIVANELMRGISGGQKKRLTTGEMLVGPAKVLFMDEISTGLDSSTTFQIVKCIQQVVHLGEATVLASLLPPAPEVFELFDDVMLLSEGQIVYQGPREYVLEFFERWLPVPAEERKEILDRPREIAPLGLSRKFNDFFSFCHLALWHIQVTSKKDQEQYWIQNEKPYHYVSVPEFVTKFKKFHMGKSLKKQLSVPFHKRKIHKSALVFSEKSVSTLELLKVSCLTSLSFLGRVLNKDIPHIDVLCILIRSVWCGSPELFANLSQLFEKTYMDLMAMSR